MGSHSPGCPANEGWQENVIRVGRHRIVECLKCDPGFSATDLLVTTECCRGFLDCRSPLSYEVPPIEYEYWTMSWETLLGWTKKSPFKEIIAVFNWVVEFIEAPINAILERVLDPIISQIPGIKDFQIFDNVNLPSFPSISFDRFNKMLEAGADKLLAKIPTASIKTNLLKSYGGVRIVDWLKTKMDEVEGLMDQACPWLRNPMSQTFINNLVQETGGFENCLNANSIKSAMDAIKDDVYAVLKQSGMKSIFDSLDFNGFMDLLGIDADGVRRRAQLNAGNSICGEWDDVGQPAFCTGPMEEQTIMPCIGFTFGSEHSFRKHFKTIGLGIAIEFCTDFIVGGWNEGFSVDFHLDLALGGMSTAEIASLEAPNFKNPSILIWMNRGQWLGHGHAVGIDVKKKFGPLKGERSLSFLFARPWTWYPGDETNEYNPLFLIPEGIQIQMDSFKELKPRLASPTYIIDRLKRFKKQLWKDGIDKPKHSVPFFIAAVTIAALSAGFHGRRLDTDSYELPAPTDGFEDLDTAETSDRRRVRASSSRPMPRIGDIMGAEDDVDSVEWDCGGCCDLLSPNSQGKYVVGGHRTKRLRLSRKDSFWSTGLAYNDVKAIHSASSSGKVQNSRCSDNEDIKFTGRLSTISEDVQEWCDDNKLYETLADDVKSGNLHASIVNDMEMEGGCKMKVDVSFENGFVIGFGFSKKGVRIEPAAMGCLITDHLSSGMFKGHCGPYCVCPGGTPLEGSGVGGCRAYGAHKCRTCDSGMEWGYDIDNVKKCTTCYASNGTPWAGSKCPSEMNGCHKISNYRYDATVLTNNALTGATWQQCRAKCMQTALCEGWQRNSNGVCKLLKDMKEGSKPIASSGTTSGARCKPAPAVEMAAKGDGVSESSSSGGSWVAVSVTSNPVYQPPTRRPTSSPVYTSRYTPSY